MGSRGAGCWLQAVSGSNAVAAPGWASRAAPVRRGTRLRLKRVVCTAPGRGRPTVGARSTTAIVSRSFAGLPVYWGSPHPRRADGAGGGEAGGSERTGGSTGKWGVSRVGGRHAIVTRPPRPMRALLPLPCPEASPRGRSRNSAVSDGYDWSTPGVLAVLTRFCICSAATAIKRSFFTPKTSPCYLPRSHLPPPPPLATAHVSSMTTVLSF